MDYINESPDDFGDWLRQQSHPEQAWQQSTRGDYLLEIASVLLQNTEHSRDVVLAACRCAGVTPSETALRLINRTLAWVKGVECLDQIRHLRYLAYGTVWSTHDARIQYSLMSAFAAACAVDSAKVPGRERPNNAATYAALSYAAMSVLDTQEAEGLLPHRLWHVISTHPSRAEHLATSARVVRGVIPWKTIQAHLNVDDARAK